MGNQNVVVPAFYANTINSLNQRNEQICKNNNGVWVKSDSGSGSHCIRCTMGSRIS